MQNQRAVIRQYVPNDATQRLFWFRRGEFRNNGGFCLSSYKSSSNRNGNWVTFDGCENQSRQKWYLSTRGISFPGYPLRSGLGFQIRSRMRYNRALFWHEHMGSGQYRLRIRNTNPGDNKQWFVFDWRTRSIRTRANRNLVISIQMNGKNWFYYSYAGVVRPYRRESLQKIRWFNGSRRNIRDLGYRCLGTYGKYNSHHRYTMWYKCNNHLS